ncbi:hypothetical protein CHS0354_004384 [Potamilus streckersoni]|uniref:Ubiquitin-associated protein 1 n=1 Tax=Potamilus streckersoni TaxID=2493646 RepID=A0AAE0W3Y2_9BIVA|nr:hypothetical protein CHS0354_004384 [Potamilus streckersoni]
MAENTIYRSSFLGSSISYLDGIPFRIGPKFIPPKKILLPPELEYNYSIRPKDPDYSFEVEEAVLRWSRERERQAQVRESQHENEEEEEEETNNSETEMECPYENFPINTAQNTASVVQNENIYENLPARNGNRSSINDQQNSSFSSKNKTNPFSNPSTDSVSSPNQFRIPSANTVANNPFLANMSDNVLQPTRIDPQKTEQLSEQKCTSNIDVTQFEKEDDPFDNIMLKTIDVMAELKTVLQSPLPIASSKGTDAPTEFVETNGPNNPENDRVLNTNHLAPGAIRPKPKTRKKKKHPVYVNMEYKLSSSKHDESLSDNPVSLKTDSSPLEISKLPPVPKSRGLVSRHSQLPPIGSHRVDSLDGVESLHGNLKSTNVNGSERLYDALPQSLPTNQTQHSVNGGMHNPLYVDLDPKNVSCSFSTRDKFSQDTGSCPNLSESIVDRPTNISPVQSLHGKFPLQAQLPLDRPSSQQSWNRYSPLPPPPPKNNTTLKMPCNSSDSDKVNMAELSPYNSLSKEAKAVADKMVSMGFSHPRVARAVEKCGHDEKQVVDFLCAVDKLTEMGYDMYQAENALLIHQNSVDRSAVYLDVLRQFSLMGFSHEKIKEALVKHNNNHDKALDFLMK